MINYSVRESCESGTIGGFYYIRTFMKAHNFKGGSISSHGYKLIYVGKQHHLADVRGYAYEHRIVAEQKIGRKLLPTEQVHHADENKLNNSPENLIVTPSVHQHRVFHRKTSKKLRMPDEKNQMIYCQCGCGEMFLKFDSDGRPRMYVSGHNPPKVTFTQDYILEALSKGQKSLTELLESYTGGKSIKTVLSKLKKQGKVVCVTRGTYALPTKP